MHRNTESTGARTINIVRADVFSWRPRNQYTFLMLLQKKPIAKKYQTYAYRRLMQGGASGS
jgi:hypothetical protein